MKSTITVSVRTLVAYAFRSGDLFFEFAGASRTLDAIRAHQKIQSSRPRDYQAEVTVALDVETEAFDLRVRGRIDGVDTSSAGIVFIEEIKTTTRPLEEIAPEGSEMHWGQAKTYAYLYAREHGLSEAGVRLIYTALDSGEIREAEHLFTLEALEGFFQDLVAHYLAWARVTAAWEGVRKESIDRLEFPFPDYRPGQRQLAVDVYRTIRAGRQLLVQAATGIGKTMAVLFPAVKALGDGHSQKIFFLTARTTGKKAAEQAILALRKKGLRLKALTLTAKDRICFCPDAECAPEACPYAKGHFDRLNRALEAIYEQDDFTRDTIVRFAGEHRVCPFEFSLELALWADAVICDYNYAFDPRVHLKRFFLEEADAPYTFLVDEAHNLVDRSREMFSAGLGKADYLALRRRVKGELPGVYQALGRINTAFVHLRRHSDARGAGTDKAPPEALYGPLRRFAKLAETWLAQNLKAPFRQDLTERYFEVSAFLRVYDAYDAAYATLYESREKNLQVTLYCLDPSLQMREAMKRSRAAVFFSATLTPAAYFKQIFGLDSSAAALALPSPFPRENLCVLQAESISTYYNQRDSTKEEVGRAIEAFIHARRGNYLVFFPSYAYLQMVAPLLDAPEGKTQIIHQEAAMGEAEREEFLENYFRPQEHTLVGLAVMGGAFGEGIDLAGDRLCGAVVVGVGLPGISPARELIRAYFDETAQKGFEFAYLFPGINRVLQAAGRVIRSETDRGAVLLADRRFSYAAYRSLLPREWRIRRVRSPEQVASVLEDFWKGGG